MPPKKEERKPLEPLFQQIPIFYEYIEYSTESLDQLNEFLTYFKPELSALLKNNVFDNMEILSQNVGIAIHPSFIKPIQNIDINDFDENTKFRNPEDNEGEQVPTLIQINSIKIDSFTLKLLDFCAGVSGVTTLKLCNNGLGSTQFALISAIINNPENKVKKVFLDWQKVDDSFLSQIQNLEFLTLRSCGLTTSQIQIICSNATNLKCLDLYDNKLSKEALNMIGQMLSQNSLIEYLGLARNGIQSFDDLSGITSNVGRFIMSEEELEEYRNKEKERDAVVERNKKVKKKGTEEPIPFLEPIQQIDNHWYIIRNSRLWLVNLSMNSIDDNSRDTIEKFLLQTSENFQLVLIGNRFDDQKALQKTKKKFGKKLVM